MMITNFMPYVILMTLRLGDATPILSASHSSRALFHLNPTLDKRTLFNVVDISDQGQQTFLQEAQKEAVDIAGIALKYMDDPAYADYLYRWFGTHEDVHDNVQGVFTNFLGGNENSEGSIVLGEVTVWQDDYWIPKNGDTPFCTREKDGRTGTAYYSPRDDKPAMHYCDKFFERKGKADYLANDCASIANHIDTTTTTRAYRGADVLHEFMHFEKVGKAQIGKQITDPAYGAYSSYVNKDKAKDGESVLNADTYVYYAMHIWLSVNCKRDFSYPRDERDD